MAKKEDIKEVVLTEQQKQIIEEVKKITSVNTIDISKLKLHKDNLDDYYSVMYNYMGTGIHIPKDEVDEFEFEKNGIGIWKTWTSIW